MHRVAVGVRNEGCQLSEIVPGVDEMFVSDTDDRAVSICALHQEQPPVIGWVVAVHQADHIAVGQAVPEIVVAACLPECRPEELDFRRCRVARRIASTNISKRDLKPLPE